MQLPVDERKRIDAMLDAIPPDADIKPINLFPFWIGPFNCMLMMSSPEYIKACVANAGRLWCLFVTLFVY